MKVVRNLLLFFTLMLAVLFLSGCTSAAEQVMPPLQYAQPVDFHIKKNAYLNWEVGAQYSSTAPISVPYNAGIAAALVTSAIDSEERHRNPGRYIFTYGKAQQAVFMTSLKSALAQNKVFSNVELAADPQKVMPKDVLITINFKSTRVADASNNYQIILDADMVITTQGKPTFKRNYFVTSDAGGVFSGKSFKEQQTDVSMQLLNKIIAGVKQWGDC